MTVGRRTLVGRASAYYGLRFPGGVRLLGMLLVAVVAACGPARAEPLVIESRTGSHEIRVELALTDATRRHGLMERTHLDADAGMLFVWPKAQAYPVRMWMKNTLIPLDMLFVDTQGRVVHIERHAQPHDLTPRGPDRPVRAVLELADGTADQLGVAVGDRVLHPALGEDDGATEAPPSDPPDRS